MTPEERFERIESTLERVSNRLDTMSTRLDNFHIEMAAAQHNHELRLRRLEEFQVILMESQNDTWRAIERLERNIEKMLRPRGGNGQEPPDSGI